MTSVRKIGLERTRCVLVRGERIDEGLTMAESIVKDFNSIRQYLKRLENERTRSLSRHVVAIEECKPEDSASISDLWISGKI
jgi:hypothetical protein